MKWAAAMPLSTGGKGHSRSPGLLAPGLHLTQCGLGRGLPPYQVAFWSIQAFGQNTPMLHTDRRKGQTGQRSDSIWRTVLQTVDQKPLVIPAASVFSDYVSGDLAGISPKCLAVGYI